MSHYITIDSCCVMILFQIIISFLNYDFSEEPEEGIDERCYRANGFFNHEEPNECNK